MSSWQPQRISLPVANERGERLVDVLAPADRDTSTIASFALMIAISATQVLLVRNARRKLWELPGGWIDGDETPEHAALRELREESGQRIAEARLEAWIVLESPRDCGGTGRLVGAVYSGTLAPMSAFAYPAEIVDAGLWSADHLPADTSAIDAALISAFMR